mgnify:CR=1 FL=1
MSEVSFSSSHINMVIEYWRLFKLLPFAGNKKAYVLAKSWETTIPMNLSENYAN